MKKASSRAGRGAQSVVRDRWSAIGREDIAGPAWKTLRAYRPARIDSDLPGTNVVAVDVAEQELEHQFSPIMPPEEDLLSLMKN